MKWRFEYAVVCGEKYWHLYHEGVWRNLTVISFDDALYYGNIGGGEGAPDFIRHLMESSVRLQLHPYESVVVHSTTVMALCHGINDPEHMVKRIMSKENDFKVWDLVNGHTWYHVAGDSGL